MTDHTDPIPDIVDRIDQMLALYARRSVPGAVPGTVSLLRDIRSAVARPVVADPATPTTPDDDARWTVRLGFTPDTPSWLERTRPDGEIESIDVHEGGVPGEDHDRLVAEVADLLNAARPAPDVLLTGEVVLGPASDNPNAAPTVTIVPDDRQPRPLVGRRVVVTAATTEDTNHGQ